MNHPLTDPSWSRNTLSRRGLVRAAFLATFAASLLSACSNNTRYATWSTAPQDYNEPFPAAPPPSSFNNQTIRQVLQISTGGDSVRVRFSNLFGKSPLKIDGAHLALSQGGSRIKPDSDKEITFEGEASATIPAGGELWSDEVQLTVKAEDNLAVSLFLATETPVATIHAQALQTNYVVSGNALSVETLSDTEDPRTSYYFISAVDVQSSDKTSVLVVFGDSITDGVGTTPSTNQRWTNFLARRLRADPTAGPVSVLNAGIAGGRIVSDAVGPKGVDRFERDVLGQSGVSHVIILLGINDIAFPAFGPQLEVSLEQMTVGMQSMIDKAKAKGVKVFVGTLLPFQGATVFGVPYYSDDFEAKRQSFNAWLRANSTVDGLIDFDQRMRDPASPLALLPLYDSGDHLHPNNKGAEAMANTVELSMLKVQP
jgi:lysophospholipase L1-like esterase